MGYNNLQRIGISDGGMKLENINKFKYLGVTIDRRGNVEIEPKITKTLKLHHMLSK